MTLSLLFEQAAQRGISDAEVLRGLFLVPVVEIHSFLQNGVTGNVQTLLERPARICKLVRLLRKRRQGTAARPGGRRRC